LTDSIYSTVCQPVQKMKVSKTALLSPSAGFTLLELLLIVVIVGVLAAIVTPSWLGFLSRQRIDTVRNDLVQTLKQSQQDAIQRRQTITIELATIDNYPTIDNGVVRELASGSGIKPGAVTMSSYSVNSSNGNITDDGTISFDYQGRPINEELPFVISLTGENFPSKRCVIIANLIGTIKTAEGVTCDNPTVEPVDPS